MPAQFIREALARLLALRLYLYYLPPSSPELNDIGQPFRVIKHHELPERTHATFDALHEAVRLAFTRYEDAHCLKPASIPGLAAEIDEQPASLHVGRCEAVHSARR